jgi:ATP-dependent Zn protease
MKVLLAGRVAEQIEFGKVTTGASDDLKKVTDISRSMVYDYGMGTTIRAHQLPGDDFTLSESLRKTRDDEVHAIAEEAYRGAHRLLSDHRDLLDAIAERLLTEESIEHDEIRSIMDREERAAPAPLPPPADAPPRGAPAPAIASKPPPADRKQR